jgi:hypothetical protein
MSIRDYQRTSVIEQPCGCCNWNLAAPSGADVRCPTRLYQHDSLLPLSPTTSYLTYYTKLKFNGPPYENPRQSQDDIQKGVPSCRTSARGQCSCESHLSDGNQEKTCTDAGVRQPDALIAPGPHAGGGIHASRLNSLEQGIGRSIQTANNGVSSTNSNKINRLMR